MNPTLTVAVFFVACMILGWLIRRLPEPWRSYMAGEDPPEDGR